MFIRMTKFHEQFNLIRAEREFSIQLCFIQKILPTFCIDLRNQSFPLAEQVPMARQQRLILRTEPFVS